jgi:hypothetical protein
VEQNHFNFFNRASAMFEPHLSTKNIALTAWLLGIIEKYQLNLENVWGEYNARKSG